jgi:phosphohistidine phosphatase
MKTIVIARHAKSDWALGLPDHERPLNGRGKKDAPRMGQALTELGYKPDMIISSTAVRARTTAEVVAHTIEHHPSIVLEADIYEFGHGAIVGILQRLPDAINNVMVFGHNPTLEQLVVYLLQMQSTIMIPTSGMVCLSTNARSWSELRPGEVTLQWFLIPKLLA